MAASSDSPLHHPLCRDTIKTRAQTAPKGQFKGPWDVAVKTLRSEGALGFYKGPSRLPLAPSPFYRRSARLHSHCERTQLDIIFERCSLISMLIGCISASSGMASPLMGVAAVNSLLFTAFSVAKRIVSPYPDLSIAQVGMAGGIAGGVNALLASPGSSEDVSSHWSCLEDR